MSTGMARRTRAKERREVRESKRTKVVDAPLETEEPESYLITWLKQNEPAISRNWAARRDAAIAKFIRRRLAKA